MINVKRSGESLGSAVPAPPGKAAWIGGSGAAGSSPDRRCRPLRRHGHLAGGLLLSVHRAAEASRSPGLPSDCRRRLRFEPNSADPSHSFPAPRILLVVLGRRSAPASASPSRGPGNGILWAETGGRFQPQNAGKRPEFGSQTATRLTNRPELRGFLTTRKPRRFAFKP